MPERAIFNLFIDPLDATTEGAKAAWTGRETPPDVLSLENMVDAELLSLRALHMQWAYDVGGRIANILEPGQPLSMWWTSLIYERHPRLSPQLYTMYKLACVEKWIKSGQPTRLRVFGGNFRLRRTLQKLCASMNIGYEWEKGIVKENPSLAPGARIYRLLPAPLRAALRMGHWWWKIRRKFRAPPQLARYVGSKLPATIVTYFPNVDLQAASGGRFISRYWEDLHSLLNAQAQKEKPHGSHFVRWLFIRFPAPGLTLEDCITLRDNFRKNGSDGLSFNFLEEFITPRGAIKALARWLRLVIRSYRYQSLFAGFCHLKDSCLDFWPWMSFEWGESFRGWRGLERCLFNEAFLRYCQLAGIQRWNLFALENCPWERMLTKAARSLPNNGPVYGAQHSSLRPTDFRYFDDPRTFSDPHSFQPDIVAGNGSSACSQWRKNAMPDKFLGQVEALRYLYLGKRKCPNRTEKGSHRILVATSFFAGETQTHLQLLQKCLEEGLFEDWEVILKPHPYLLPLQWLDSLPPALKHKIELSERPIEQEFCGINAVWTSNSTTVALEAALAGLPVMVMAARNDFDLCPIQDIPGLLRTASISDVIRAIPKLAPLTIAPDYLDLDPLLPGWRNLLGISAEMPIK